MRLEEISGEVLNRAVELYMEHAYKGRRPRTQALPRFAPGENLGQILQRPNPFEDLTSPVPTSAGSPARVYALRLGNMSYPHMKLALVEALYPDDFVFTVDRHDSFNFDPAVPGYEAWCELKELNRLFKESIERAWHDAGLPTLEGLREEQLRAVGQARTLQRSGNVILILDDDVSRAGLLCGILTAQGCEPVVGPPGEPPKVEAADYLEAVQRAKGSSVRLLPRGWTEPLNVDELCGLIVRRRVALTILDVSYWTGQGPRVASALRLDARSQEVPILGIYSRRDFGPDTEVFSASLRRPYRAEALLALVAELLQAGQ